MSSLNKVQVIGHVGRDPEIRTMPNGDTVTNFSVAASEKWEGGEHTEWFRCVAFKKIGDICGKYLHKGKQVYVEGRLKTHSYEDKKDGSTKYSTEVIVRDVVLLGRAQDGETSDAAGRGSPSPAEQPELPGGEVDDDIPF